MNKQDDYTPVDDSRGYPWIKIRTGLIDNPRFFTMSDTARSLYFELYILAGKSDAGGLILIDKMPLTPDLIAWVLRRDSKAVGDAIGELTKQGWINLDDDQVTICRFASEQGPAAKVQREQWALRQAKRRALAKAEAGPETDKIENSETVKDLKTRKETDKDKELKTQTQRVTLTSHVSHAGVTRDIATNEGEREFEGLFNDVLVLWHDIKGREYIPTPAFSDLIKYWVSEEVEISHIRKALEQVKDTALTPFYLRDVAINAKSSDPKIKEQANLDHFRELYRQQKNNGGNE